MTKILYSPGFGAGYSTWNSGSREFEKFILTYQPFIEFLEADEKNVIPEDEEHPLVKQFLKDCLDKFNQDYVCILGLDQLQVTEVSGPFTVEEYDGSESIRETSDLQFCFD